MAHDSLKSLDNALVHVRHDRRGFLTTLLVGSAFAAIPLMTSEAIAQDAPACDPPKKVNKKGECVLPKKKAEFR